MIFSLSIPLFFFNIFLATLLANCCQILLLLSALLVCWLQSVHRAHSCAAVHCPNSYAETFYINPKILCSLGLLHSLWRGMIWHFRWRPSTAGCRRTPRGWGCTGSPCSWVSHRSPTHRSPPWWSYSGWSMCAGRHSRCCSCSSGPGISSPQRMWSVAKVRGKKYTKWVFSEHEYLKMSFKNTSCSSFILPSPFGCTVNLILCCSPIKVFIDKQNVQSVASLWYPNEVDLHISKMAWCCLICLCSSLMMTLYQTHAGTAKAERVSVRKEMIRQT